MDPLSAADTKIFRHTRVVLTDMDETLTFRGQLAARTYNALERLQAHNIVVIPVTGAPAGWCDQMARMWPIDGVIGENGGLYFSRKPARNGVEREFWHDLNTLPKVMAALDKIAADLGRRLPGTALADDQPFRLTSLAFDLPFEPSQRALLAQALRDAGANITENNLWLLAWLGEYDKLAMARRVLAQHYGLDADRDRHAIVYVGDSLNDAPMFGHFPHSVGVSTVKNALPRLPTPPAWVTDGPGGEGFIEIADAILDAVTPR